MPMRCPICHEGTIEPVAKAGRTLPHRNLEAVPLPEDVALPTCSHCGEFFLHGRQMLELDAHLERAYEKQMQALNQRALDVMVRHRSQREWERLLGLSAGYLSKIRGGDKGVNPTLTALLQLISYDPEGRGTELEHVWSGRPPSSVPAETPIRTTKQDCVRYELPTQSEMSRPPPSGNVVSITRHERFAA